MQPKNALKREREKGAYLWRGFRSARKRERPERWPDERKRGERRMGLLKKMRKKNARKEEKKN